MKKDTFEIAKLFATIFGWFFNVLIIVISGVYLKDLPDTNGLRILLCFVAINITIIFFSYIGKLAKNISK